MGLDSGLRISLPSLFANCLYKVKRCFFVTHLIGSATIRKSNSECFCTPKPTGFGYGGTFVGAIFKYGYPSSEKPWPNNVARIVNDWICKAMIDFNFRHMAYRATITINDNQLSGVFREMRDRIPEAVGGMVRDATDLIVERAKQNLSGVPFTSSTGTHVINKRTGRLVASVDRQYPYGSPFRARIFAGAMTRYADNPEEYDYGAILEYGRGEIRPKYTPAARAGYASKARLAIPGGGHQLVQGQGGFRGITGRYSFAKSIPPMEGKYWMQSAAEAAIPDIEQMIEQRTERLTNG